MSKIKGTINLPDVPVGDVYTDSGVFSPPSVSIGGTVVGGGANRVLFENASQVLSTDANFIFNSTGLGVGTSPSAKLHIVSTTEQLRLGYDTSNYLTITVASNGNPVFDSTGTGEQKFTFNDLVESSVFRATAALQVQHSEGVESYIKSDDVSLGNTDSFLHVRESTLNQWHAHPNDLMLDTTGLIQIGDPQFFASGTRVEIDDATQEISLIASGLISIGDIDDVSNSMRIKLDVTNGLLSIQNHVGAIQLGDIGSLGNNIVFAVRDDTQRFALSNGNDATPFGFDLPSSGGGFMVGMGSAQLLGFWGATPIARPSTSHAAASFTANSGTAVNDASTFDGYTLKQVVKALRDTGLLS